MNYYIKLINLFHQLRRRVGFSSCEMDLYFTLLNECNALRWETFVFELKNTSLIDTMGVSEPTIIRAREKLKDTGFIEVEPGANKWKKPTYTIIIDLNKISLSVSQYLEATRNKSGVGLNGLSVNVGQGNSQVVSVNGVDLNNVSQVDGLPVSQVVSSILEDSRLKIEDTIIIDDNEKAREKALAEYVPDMRLTAQAILPLEECLQAYLHHPVCQQGKELLVMKYHMDAENPNPELLPWLQQFNEKLIKRLDRVKQLSDYSGHFGNWMNIHYKKETPGPTASPAANEYLAKREEENSKLDEILKKRGLLP